MSKQLVFGYLVKQMSQKTKYINSETIEWDICKKLERIRLLKNISQAKLAEAAGVSRRTISRMENGGGISLDTFIRVMQALDLTDHLTAMLPNSDIRPVERAGRKGKGERKNASSPRTPKKTKKWEWGSKE